MPRTLPNRLTLDREPDGARRAVEDAAAIDGWQVISAASDRLTLREVPRGAPTSTFAAQVAVHLVSVPGGPQTLIQLDAFSVGLGRIQRGHMYARVEELKRAIVACAAR